MVGSILSGFNSIFIFLVVLSILIIVHEWGHFITAKKLGIEVQRFALGFGPTIFSRKYNGTNYMINAIPLGGYVKMAGDERSECLGKPTEFYSKSVGHRSLVVLNGPVVNFVLAYLSFVLVFMIGYPGQTTRIEYVKPDGPAYIAGIRPGDQVLAIDSKKVYGWLNLETRLEGSSSEEIEVTVLRGDRTIKMAALPRVIERPNLVGRDRMIRDLGINNLPNIIGGVVPKYPAEEAGLMQGDRIVGINEEKINSYDDPINVLNTEIIDLKQDLLEIKKQLAISIADEKRFLKQFDSAKNAVTAWEKKQLLAEGADQSDLVELAAEKIAQYQDERNHFRDCWENQKEIVNGIKEHGFGRRSFPVPPHPDHVIDEAGAQQACGGAVNGAV